MVPKAAHCDVQKMVAREIMSLGGFDLHQLQPSTRLRQLISGSQLRAATILLQD